ncbi:MAG: hypothetical protein SFW64_00305 [Alphaproteobacteria bacterium]|nr:hypothetical protein [Alphaproteobacteria bacterium]
MKTLTLAVVSLAALAATPAQAGTHVSFGFYAPAPVYYAPPPVVYYPPVQYAYYAPPVVYGYGYGVGAEYGRRHHHRHHRHMRPYSTARNDHHEGRYRD